MYAVIIFVFRTDDVLNLLEYCQTRRDYEDYDDELKILFEYNEKHSLEMKNRVTRYFSFQILSGYSIMMFIALFLFPLIFPSYPFKLAIPYHIPYIGTESLIGMFLNYVHQTWAIGNVAIVANFYLSIQMILAVHVVTSFGLMAETTRIFYGRLIDLKFGKDSSVNSEIIYQLLKIISGIYSELYEKLSLMCAVTSQVFLSMEMSTVAMCLVDWMIIKINKDNYFVAFGPFTVIALYFTFSFVGQKILDKVSKWPKCCVLAHFSEKMS